MKKIKIEDRLYTIAYISNLVGYSYRKIPTITASEVSIMLANEFIGEWDGKQETHIEDMEEFLARQDKRLREVAREF